MKLKIKYSSTKKFTLNFDGPTVDELLAAVIAFIANTYGDECDNVSLSLNGRDPLPSGPNMTLAEAGVVAADLLTVIEGRPDPPPSAGGAGVPAGGAGVPAGGAGVPAGGAGVPAGGAGVPAGGAGVPAGGAGVPAGGVDGGAAGGSGGDASSDATGGASSQGGAGGASSQDGAGGASSQDGAGGASSQDGAGGASSRNGAGGDKTPIAASATAGDRDDARQPAVFLPTSLLDVQFKDGGAAIVPESLSHTLSQCRPKSQGQLVNLLCHITMVECGFVPSGTGGPLSNADRFLPPSGWDDMVANLSYTHKSYAGFSCTLVLVSMGPLKQILVSFPRQDVEISTKVSVTEYAEDLDYSGDRPVGVGDLRNVSKLAQKLRNELLVPLQLAAHRILDLPSPFHLAGLPSEILLLTLRLLDVRSVLNVSQTCRRLHDSCMDDALWQHLYRRDLGSPPSSAGDGPRWVTLYKERYKQRKTFNIGWQQPNPPQFGDFPQPRIYPTGPLHPTPPGFPYPPQPVGPYPVLPDPSHPFNPYRDPDSPYFGGDIPNHPPYPIHPGGPGIGPLGPGIDPFGPDGRDPLNPFGDPQFGGLGPGLPRRPQHPRRPGGSGPDFRFI